MILVSTLTRLNSQDSAERFFGKMIKTIIKYNRCYLCHKKDYWFIIRDTDDDETFLAQDLCPVPCVESDWHKALERLGQYEIVKSF